MLAYGLLSYLDNSANTIMDNRNHYGGENSPLLLNSSIFYSISAYSSFWYYFDCMHSNHIELYQFFCMTNDLKGAERERQPHQQHAHYLFA